MKQGPTGHQVGHAGEPWSEDEYVHLVDEPRAGLTLEEIAAIHERSVGAIRARVAKMVPAEEVASPRSTAALIGWLREHLAQGECDWHRCRPISGRGSRSGRQRTTPRSLPPGRAALRRMRWPRRWEAPRHS